MPKTRKWVSGKPTRFAGLPVVSVYRNHHGPKPEVTYEVYAPTSAEAKKRAKELAQLLNDREAQAATA